MFNCEEDEIENIKKMEFKEAEPIINFPKIESPFIRKALNGRYLATSEIAKGYEWVFEDSGVLAVDKLHGTNLCCIFNQGILQSVDNRTNRLIAQPCISANWKTDTYRVVEGIINCIKRGWIDKFFTGRVYGELVGPTINGNLHDLETHYFVPFDYLKKSCKWNSWTQNKYPKTYEAIKEWFKYLPSLFTNKITKTISSTSEGIVFHHPDGRMAKLRRDMFDLSN